MRQISALILSLAIGLTGCASGIKHKDLAASIPALQADQGRIYFYRSANIIGAGIQPSIKLDGVVVGDSKPGGFFFVDSKPGNHEVVCTTETDKKLTFTLDKGEVKYVKSSVGLGVIVYRVFPELVNSEEAQKDLSDLSYTGAPLSKN